MKIRCKCLILLLSIATAFGADKDEGFRPGAADTFEHQQSVSGLTVAADAYSTEEEAKQAFGKLDPNKYGVLPVLVVMQNNSGEALRLDEMKVSYIRADGREYGAVPADDVPYLRGVQRPQTTPGPRPSPIPRNPIPGLGGGNRNNNPLAAWEIEGRRFAAEMLPPGDSAYGFFYFDVLLTRGSLLYITGIREASTGQELFYMEIPLE